MRAACIPVLLPLVAPLLAAPESYPCQNGLVRSLVAREPMFVNPVSVAVDTDGSIYVTETTRRKQADLDIREAMWWVTDDLSHTSVAEKRDFFRKNITSERFRKHPSLKDHNGDGTIDWKDLAVHSEKIHRLVDTDGDGVADQHTLFAEGFNTEVTGIAAGVLAHRGDVYATIAPDVWKLRDTTGDGKADRREAIASGFGVHINYAGHDMHGLTFGPDGKLYWTIGDKGTNVESGGKRWIYPHEGAVLRCNPDGSGFEVFARGLRNVQQIAFDDYGYLFGVDNDSDQKGEKERLVYIPEGSDHGWRCYYQYRGGKYNPWMEERIAFPDGDDRPASILPPLALYLDGPSGFAYNPGTALNERYRGHFFLTQFPAGKINAFQLEPDGASFKMKGDHLMASGTAFTGCNFGPDGALYVADWQGGYPLKEKGAVWKIDDPKEAGSAMRREVAAMLKEGPSKIPDGDLIKRLAHADKRVRLDAQWKLAERSKLWSSTPSGYLASVFKGDSVVAKVHVLWMLAQVGHFDETLFANLAKSTEPELRGQAAKWAGETAKQLPGKSFAPLLTDPEPRVRFLAAMAVGKAKDANQLDGVIAMLEANAGKDAFLQHAGAFAIQHSFHADSIKKLATHASAAVRMALTIALRNLVESSMRITKPDREPGDLENAFAANALLFEIVLKDPDPAIVAEAARALHDAQQTATFLKSDKFGDLNHGALAKLLEVKPDARESALRRSIATNRRIGDETCLLRLANFAANATRPATVRLAALEALASVRSNEPLDMVDGHYAPLEPLEIDAALVSKIASVLSPLTNDKQVSKAVGSALDALGAKQDSAALTRQALDPALEISRRFGALQHLKDAKAPSWADTALTVLRDSSPSLRAGVAALLADARPGPVLAYVNEVGLKAPDLAERQAAVRLLAALPDSKPVLDGLLAKLTAGKLEPALQLEVIESASSLQLDSLHEAQAVLAAKGPLGKWSYALAGGNAAAGKKVFEENLAANCTACHRIEAEGSNVGPPLTRVGTKAREYLLESLVTPQAKVAPGYGMMSATKKDGTTIAGAFLEEKDGKLILAQADGSKLEVPLGDISSKTGPVSTMPPMDAILKPAELRDLVEFLSTLK